jgi:hypothetical protein
MILPSQILAVRQWVADALADAGKPIPLERILQGNQDANTQRPYVELLVTGAIARGPVAERRASGSGAALERRQHNVGQATVSITVVGPVARESLAEGASSYIPELYIRTQAQDISDPLDAAGLGLLSSTQILGVDALTGQSQYETRATLDLAFNTNIVLVQTPGAVSTVPVTGTTEPPTPIGTVEVSAP